MFIGRLPFTDDTVRRSDKSKRRTNCLKYVVVDVDAQPGDKDVVQASNVEALLPRIERFQAALHTSN